MCRYGRAVAMAACAVLAMLASPSGIAQTRKVQVYVELASKDPVGKQLGRLIEQRIAASATLALATDPGDSVLQLRLATLDPGILQQGDQTAYSAVWTFGAGNMNQYYASSRVGVCGKRRLAACASDLMRITDQEANAIRRAAHLTADSPKQASPTQ